MHGKSVTCATDDDRFFFFLSLKYNDIDPSDRHVGTPMNPSEISFVKNPYFSFNYSKKSLYLRFIYLNFFSTNCTGRVIAGICVGRAP